MGWTAEDAEDLVTNYLSSNLAAKLAAIATARSVTVPAPVKITKIEPLALQVPLVFVHVQEAEYDWGPEDAPLKEGPVRNFGVTIRVTHGIAATGGREGLRETLQRYEEAIVDLIVTDWTFGNAAVRIISEGADFTPETGDDESPLLYQEMILTCSLRRHP